MHYSTPSTAPPPQQLPSPTEAARARALRAEARLRTVLQQVSALRCAQQEGGGDHVSQHRDPVAGAAEATSELSQASSSPPAHRNAAPTAAAAAASSPPPCPLVLEFPLAPLEQRVKQKKPLGVVAARFLSAAASGAPSIFPDVAITSTSAADGHMSDWLASTPPPAAAQMSHALPSTATTSGPCPGTSPHRAGRGKHTAPPSPASSMHEIPHQSPPPHERGQRCRCGHSPHRHQRLLSSVSASRHSRDSAGDSPSPLALLLRTPPSVSGSQAPTQSATINAMSKRKQVRPSLRHQGSTPTTKTSHPAGVFGNSSISFLARTLREAGTAALAASPLTRSEMRHTPAAGHRHAGHYRGSRLREKLERSSEGVNVSVAASSPTRTRWPASPGPSHSGSSSHAADGCLPHSSHSSCNFSCVCSRSGCDSWSGSAASWSASSSRTSFARGVRSPPSEPFTPLTIPLDGRYDPHAPLLPLMGCYGDTPTREVFCRVPSTSTQHTASRSSTPMSSEWSIESSSTAQTAVGAAEAAPVAGFCALNAPGEAVSTAARAQGSEEPVKRQREQQLESQHRRRSMLFSSTANTQQSYMAEMDAIERGVVAPYVSYLFSPEARVIDLRQLKGRARLCDPAPALEATCLGFSRAADEYLVGTSSGLLWRVPAGGGAEAMRATPLGSLWPPYAPTSANPAATAASGTTTGAGDSSGAVGDAPGGGPSKLLPVPLAGHTAAILSIAFNDDGALFATTGMDGCVIVWNASTSAKLRRISAVWASSTSPSSAAASTSMYADVDGAASQRAPHLVHFMPQNNNYLLVSYLGSSELHLYNSSTGLPVTNVAGAALARAAASTVKVHHKSAVGSHSRGRAGAGSAASSGAITALAVDPVASPFFFSGDAGGTVVMWTYRAGDVVARATLRTTTAASSPTALAGSGAGKHARTPTYLPELRRVTALALPEQLGGIAALGVSTLHISQLHSLFRRCGPRRGAASAQSTSDGGAVGPRPAPRHPFESAAEVFRAVAQQNRACWTAALPGAAAADGVARNQRDSRGRSDAHPQAALHGGPAAFTAVTVTSDDNSSLPQVLARWPSRLSETFSALWRGGDGAPPSAAHSGLAPARHERKLASTAAKGSMAAASTAGAAAPATAPSEGDFLHQLRDDALDAVCPLLVLVTLPCDTIYALGVLLQLQPGGRRGSAGGRGGVVAAGTPQVSYCLYPLLKTTSPSRLRHLGVGAVQSPDNPRLIVVATPCEEGFVRVEPLLHVATPSPSVQRTPPAGVSAIPTPGVGSLQPGNKAAAYDDGRHRSHSHVLATLPMPYGGRCTGVAWSPNGRFLVAITAEGVIYQWARVYLLGPSSPSANAAAAAATAAKGNVAPVGGRDGVAPAHGMAPAEGEVEVRSSPARGGIATGEEDAWRKSLHRELERQRRAQAALKLVAHVRAGGEDGAMSSSGYWLDDDDAANSAVTEDWLEVIRSSSVLLYAIVSVLGRPAPSRCICRRAFSSMATVNGVDALTSRH
ncbi:WD domain, G-beta repeat family protein [Leishmania donovani]|uniref:WD domain, G-beta repeat family protein n=1 Tax=Leishmania donovani TaxID=5661 RepID=A0A504Y906_LEIDO|nr:WD domain, G-beta repeat family protein [Leishmania donovani]